jgi:hypothetical protein
VANFRPLLTSGVTQYPYATIRLGSPSILITVPRSETRSSLSRGASSRTSNSEEVLETFIAHCDVAARDLLMPYSDLLIVLSTELRIKRTLTGEEIDDMIANICAGFELAAERRRRWNGSIRLPMPRSSRRKTLRHDDTSASGGGGHQISVGSSNKKHRREPKRSTATATHQVRRWHMARRSEADPAAPLVLTPVGGSASSHSTGRKGLKDPPSDVR